MQRSESIKALAKALVLAKSKMEAPTKNKTNPHFKSKYADLATVKDSYQAALAEQGLTIIHALSLKDTVLTLTTTLLHAESEEWIDSDFPIPAGLKAQEIGSAVSYGKRYNGCALLDIVAEDDDDGNAASKPAEKVGTPAPKPTSAVEPKPSELTREERMAVTSLAKRKGLLTDKAFSQFLSNLCPEAKSTADLSKSELVAVTDALNAMPDASVAQKGAA